jgi:hypothetical protein
MMFFWALAPCRLVGRGLPTSLHGAKTQKSIILTAAVKISNLKQDPLFTTYTLVLIRR